MPIKRPIPIFIAVTFLLGWTLQFSARLAHDAGQNGLFGLLVLLTTAVPAGAGLLALRFGVKNENSSTWASGLWAWRQPLNLYLLGVGLFVLPWLFVAGFNTIWHGNEFHFNAGALALIPILLLSAFFEEIGWRRFLLDRLLQRWGPLSASLSVGLLWGIWHVVDYIRQPFEQYGFLFLILILLLISHSLIYTWLYLKSKRSVPLLAVAHAATNLAAMAVSPTDVLAADTLLIRMGATAIFVIIAAIIRSRDTPHLAVHI